MKNKNNQILKHSAKTHPMQNNPYVNNEPYYEPSSDYINEEYIIGPGESRSGSFFNENQQNFSDYSLIGSNDMYDNVSFYNVNKNTNYKDKKNPNYIKGIYIESPYDE